MFHYYLRHRDIGVKAIENLMVKKGKFDYILLETTGLADPGKHEGAPPGNGVIILLITGRWHDSPSVLPSRGSIQFNSLLFCLLFYSIATVFQLYHGHDMMYEMRRRKPDPTLLPTQEIFNPPAHIGMVFEELAFDDAVSYTHHGNGLQHS